MRNSKGKSANTESSVPLDIASNATTQEAHPATPLRNGSKAAALLELLTREQGASLDEMIERTGWLSHTVRAAMTGLRKKGHAIDKRVSGNTTIWFVVS